MRSAQIQDHRVYQLAGDPSALQAALESEKIGKGSQLSVPQRSSSPGRASDVRQNNFRKDGRT